MPTSQFPPVNPVDPTSQLNSIQSAISTLQSTVNGLSSSSPILPTKPYKVINIAVSSTSGQYYDIINISGKGCLNYVLLSGGYSSFNKYIQITIDGGTPYVVSSNFGYTSNSVACSTGSSDSNGNVDYITNLYFNNSLRVQMMQNGGGPATLEGRVDYALV